MRRFFRRFLAALAVIFVLPALAMALWWVAGDRPDSWHEADWSASGVLPRADERADAAVYVMAARTGGLKGALSTHSWIVTLEAGADSYVRYDKVGWGAPVRRNAYPADGHWYSNPPEVVGAVTGPAAARLIPAIEAAVAAYPHRGHGDYRIYPGPNSNTFVAHVLAAVPALDIVLPPTAVGRDFPADGRLVAFTGDGVRATLSGLFGITARWGYGLEVHLAGLVAGIDIARPALLVPGFGRIGMDQAFAAETPGALIPRAGSRH